MGFSCRLIRKMTDFAICVYFPVSRTVMNFKVVMIAFKKVMPAKAQYTQSCLAMPAHTSTAPMKKKRIAVLRYHSGDALRR